MFYIKILWHENNKKLYTQFLVFRLRLLLLFSIFFGYTFNLILLERLVFQRYIEFEIQQSTNRMNKKKITRNSLGWNNLHFFSFSFRYFRFRRTLVSFFLTIFNLVALLLIFYWDGIIKQWILIGMSIFISH